MAVWTRDSTPNQVLLARSLTAVLSIATALLVGACARTEPHLRLAVADGVESTDLESGSTLVVRGGGFPIGAPVELFFAGARRSFVHPGAFELTLPAHGVAHDRVEVPLDASTTALLLGEGDDDARLSGEIELQFRTAGAVVSTKPIDVELRVRSFPRNARVAAEKRTSVDESLDALGLHVGRSLAIDTVASCIFRRGNIMVGDRLTVLDGVALTVIDDAIPPPSFGFVDLESVSEDGTLHHARGFLGLRRMGMVVLVAALSFGIFQLVRRIRPAEILPSVAGFSVPPTRASLGATAAAAVIFELATRFLRVRLDAPIVLTLLSIALFGPQRRAVMMAIALSLATSAALVSGGVFRVDELHGALGPFALPSLALALYVWAQRFGGYSQSRSATTGLLFVALPLLHVVAPRVGVVPALGRALAATMLCAFSAPVLQRAMVPVRAGASGASVTGALIGSLVALAAAIVAGPVAGAATAFVVVVVAYAASFVLPAFRGQKPST